MSPLRTESPSTQSLSKKQNTKKPLCIQLSSSTLSSLGGILTSTQENKGALYQSSTNEFHFYQSQIDWSVKQQSPEIHTQIKTHLCPSCRTLSLVSWNGMVTCQNNTCGICLGNELDKKPEWNEQVGYRCNQMSSQNDMFRDITSYGTYGTKISYHANQTHVRRFQHWLGADYKERSLKHKLNNIRQVCTKHQLKETIIHQAYEYYHQLYQIIQDYEDKKRGYNDIGLQACSVYFSLVNHQKIRSYREVAQMFGIDQKYVSDGMKLFFHYMGDILPIQSDGHLGECKNYLSRYINRLFNQDIQGASYYSKIISNVLTEIDRYHLLDSNILTTSVAGTIYFVLLLHGFNISVRRISEFTETSHPTISKVTRELLQFKELLLPVVYPRNSIEWINNEK